MTDESVGSGVNISAIDSICGCGGKTSLRKVVYPAREQIAERLEGSPVELPPTSEAAILPNATSYRRSVFEQLLEGEHGPTDYDEADDEVWTLTATLADEQLGTSTDLFADRVGEAYRSLSGMGGTTIGKAHSIQIADATTPIQWFEHIEPTGTRKPGFAAGNVDIVHAFPGLDGVEQAAIAANHSLNDCYSMGAYRDRAVRPVVATPRDEAENVSRELVSSWFEQAVSDSVTVLEPAILRHDGDGWQFGATATATGDHEPPTRESRVESGDAVLVHRPCGGLAMYRLGIERDEPRRVRERAFEYLGSDHRRVAEVISEFCPDSGAEFDASEHIKFATDISGPGIRGLERPAEKSDKRFHVTDVPVLNEELMDRIHDRWILPDVTVETNGPLAVVAAPDVVRKVARRIAELPDAQPTVFGEFRESRDDRISIEEGVDNAKYVEWSARVDT